MGSASDWSTMKRASEMLDSFEIAHECNALSAHRNAEILREYLEDADKRGIELFICAAGGAAHLAGVVAAHTEKPVLGCPMQANMRFCTSSEVLCPGPHQRELFPRGGLVGGT